MHSRRKPLFSKGDKAYFKYAFDFLLQFSFCRLLTSCITLSKRHEIQSEKKRERETHLSSLFNRARCVVYSNACVLSIALAITTHKFTCTYMLSFDPSHIYIIVGGTVSLLTFRFSLSLIFFPFFIETISFKMIIRISMYI